jgi:hypothetical protein
MRGVDGSPVFQDKIMIYGPKADGTYIIEFRKADGESLAISIPRTFIPSPGFTIQQDGRSPSLTMTFEDLKTDEQCASSMREIIDILPVGRFKLATRPYLTGSSPVATTMGIVVVAALAARPATAPPAATMTATWRLTRSAASEDSLSYRPAAQANSVAIHSRLL